MERNWNLIGWMHRVVEYIDLQLIFLLHPTLLFYSLLKQVIYYSYPTSSTPIIYTPKPGYLLQLSYILFYTLLNQGIYYSYPTSYSIHSETRVYITVIPHPPHIDYHTEIEVDIRHPWGLILKGYEREKGEQP